MRSLNSHYRFWGSVSLVAFLFLAASVLSGCSIGRARTAVAAANNQTEQAVELARDVSDGKMKLMIAALGATRTGSFLRLPQEKKTAIECLLIEVGCYSPGGDGVTAEELEALSKLMEVGN